MIYYRLLDRVIWVEALENSGNFPRFSPPQTMLVAGNFLISSKLNYFWLLQILFNYFHLLSLMLRSGRKDEDGSVGSVQLSPFGQSFKWRRETLEEKVKRPFWLSHLASETPLLHLLELAMWRKEHSYSLNSPIYPAHLFSFVHNFSESNKTKLCWERKFGNKENIFIPFWYQHCACSCSMQGWRRLLRICNDDSFTEQRSFHFISK